MNKYVKTPIFLIEDNAVFNFWLNTQLDNSANYQIYNYPNAEEAMTDLLSIKPKYIILDYQLGAGMNGHAALLKIKSVLPDVQVIILSGLKDEALMDNMIRAGADMYVVKDKEAVKELLQSLA